MTAEERSDHLLALVERIAVALEKQANIVTKPTSKKKDLQKELEIPPTSDEVPLKCPKCGDSMVVRHRRTDGSKFWGCSNFPKCNGIRTFLSLTAAPPDLEDDEDEDCPL